MNTKHLLLLLTLLVTAQNSYSLVFLSIPGAALGCGAFIYTKEKIDQKIDEKLIQESINLKNFLNSKYEQELKFHDQNIECNSSTREVSFNKESFINDLASFFIKNNVRVELYLNKLNEDCEQMKSKIKQLEDRKNARCQQLVNKCPSINRLDLILFLISGATMAQGQITCNFEGTIGAVTFVFNRISYMRNIIEAELIHLNELCMTHG